MNSIDMLRQKRESNYGEKPGGDPQDANRSFTLSDEEKQMIGSEGPVTLTVTGTCDPDGKFTIESVSPAGGGDEQEKPMPVQTQTQLSPS